MPKKKQLDVVASMQIVFRVPETLYAALQAAAAGLGVDLSNLLRMLIAENIGQYVERGRKAAAALEQAGLSAQPAAAPEQQARKGAAKRTTSGGRPRRSIILDTAADQEGTPEVT
jgi:hypothetical protein